MKLPTRTTTAIAAAFAFTALPAAGAFAQEAGCEVVEGTGSAAGDIEDCPDEEVAVLPGRIDRPAGAPADEGEEPVDAAPAVQSRAPDVAGTELARTGTDADVALVAGLAALTLGGGALAATRRRQRTDS